ncbi:MAG: hypothetical protein ACKOPS_08990 [Cyanobium sp.]
MARTVLQGSELLKFFVVPDEQKDGCMGVLFELMRHILRCVEIRDRISAEVAEGKALVEKTGFQLQSKGRSVSLPGVADLRSNSEAFLQSSKLALRETAQLVMPFYAVPHDHRFHKFESWSATKFGKDDPFTQIITQWEPWVKQIVDMRNAVDHPAQKPGGKLVTHNFRMINISGKPSLIEPAWSVSGGSDSPIVADMEAIIEGTIELGEELLVGLLYKFKGGLPIVVYEVPMEERDPSCPLRFHVGLAANILNT